MVHPFLCHFVKYLTDLQYCSGNIVSLHHGFNFSASVLKSPFTDWHVSYSVTMCVCVNWRLSLPSQFFIISTFSVSLIHNTLLKYVSYLYFKALQFHILLSGASVKYLNDGPPVHCLIVSVVIWLPVPMVCLVFFISCHMVLLSQLLPVQCLVLFFCTCNFCFYLFYLVLNAYLYLLTFTSYTV